MNFFLRLRHWQLFLLLFVVPFLIQIISLGTVIGAHDARAMFLIFPIIMLCYIGTYFGWLYSVGAAMHKKTPFPRQGKLSRFQLFMLIPVLYMLCISAFMAFMSQSGFVVDGRSPALMILIILPVHLFSMFCIFYCLYFCAKALKAAELQRPVTFSDCAGEFFLLWFFPIGVWILQPRINRLAAGADNQEQLMQGQVFP